MHYHLMRFQLYRNPAGYFIFWYKAEAQRVLANHIKCCYPGHQVIECTHPECLVELMAL
jgi:hypothetical protein